jgi:dTDP-4-amino-4,6-dideoxygalactose transaminase
LSDRRIPFLKPNPAALSAAHDELLAIETSGIFTNFGPQNASFERRLVDELFSGEGHCVTVSNATIGLILAIRSQLPTRVPNGAMALMPSFTFAATAHAALWAGLTPLLCDVDEGSWLPSPESEEHLLRSYGSRIVAIVPYATFGGPLDLERYEWLSRRYDVSVVIDAAASLGTRESPDKHFGVAFDHPIVFSLQATKTFSTAEAGLVYCNDAAAVQRVREMANFGFGEPRHATMPGLNGKLSEVGALLGCLKLDHLSDIVERRWSLYERYRENLPSFSFQAVNCYRQAHQFVPVLVPQSIAGRRDEIIVALAQTGIEVAKYFSPHIGSHRYFMETCVAGPLLVTEEVSRRSLSLPLSDTMALDDVDYVCSALVGATT